MKPCDPRWREELANHALGLPASSALREHLASCAVCSATLREWQARIQKVDAGVQQLTASEPSPNAQSRLLAELRSKPQHAWLRRWQWQTGALCGLFLVIALSFYRWKVFEQRREAEKLVFAASAIGRWKSPTEGLLRSSNDRWLAMPPQLGKYFYPLDAHVPAKENAKP